MDGRSRAKQLHFLHVMEVGTGMNRNALVESPRTCFTGVHPARQLHMGGANICPVQCHICPDTEQEQ